MIICNKILLNLHNIINSLYTKNNLIRNRILEDLFYSHQYPGLEKKDIRDLILVLWKIDTRGDSITWSLFHTKGKYFLRKIKLQKITSYPMLTPNIFGSEKNIATEKVFEIVNSIPKISQKLQKPNYITIDGIKFGIISKKINIEWWDQSCLPLDIWFNQTIQIYSNLGFA